MVIVNSYIRAVGCAAAAVVAYLFSGLADGPLLSLAAVGMVFPLGPSSVAATLTEPRQRKKGGPSWQYHPRSDHHSKVVCLLMALDLLLASESLRDDVQRGRIAIGINHRIRDFRSKRTKRLDLVFHRPAAGDTRAARGTFAGLLREYGVVLTPKQQAAIDTLPEIPVRDVVANGVYIALEAKAAMTEFSKARPRLFDELNSAHAMIHGDSNMAIAAACVLVNAADSFVSPIRSPLGSDALDAVTTVHRQPKSFDGVIDTIRELPLRSDTAATGFDAIGILPVELRNDGSLVQEVSVKISGYDYEGMINRVAHLYENRFHRG